ncbi:MAG: uracil-DNA glycosylase [Candidatus Izemoplasmatales bacterium]|nr:uracil-DNA glycosylase [Candidatus Izemoplasmatales bacterium]
MLDNDWQGLLQDEFQKPYFVNLVESVKAEYNQFPCYPPIHHVFQSLRETSFQDTKVLILGQDPYHNEFQAMGLSFSVPGGIELPPSLQNIFTELVSDLGVKKPVSGDLTPWANQGVLLLNAILSVRAHQPLSHQRFGWMTFTDHIISLLNQKTTPMVFVLWGSFARSKKALITNPIHLILESAHPSPLSAYRGFFGSRPFSRINEFLLKTGQTPIDFSL